MSFPGCAISLGIEDTAGGGGMMAVGGEQTVLLLHWADGGGVFV